MPEVLSARTPQTPASSSCSVQIVLFTYRAGALADEIFASAADLAMRRSGLRVAVAWGGGGGPAEDAWLDRVNEWRRKGADVALFSHESSLERLDMALAHPGQWVLPVADDDPIAVNYLRALVDGCSAADARDSAVLPSNHLQNFDAHSRSTRVAGWRQTEAADRLGAMLSEPGRQGAVFWSAYRREIVAGWLAFARRLPFHPAYLDQFLPHLAACTGRLAVAREETVLLKDERNWQSDQHCHATNVRYYPRAEMALYHEWFWAADLWSLLGEHTDRRPIADAMQRWSRTMLAHMLDVYVVRRSSLASPLSPCHVQVLERLRHASRWLFEDIDDGRDTLQRLDSMREEAHAVRTELLASVDARRPVPEPASGVPA